MSQLRCRDSVPAKQVLRVLRRLFDRRSRSGLCKTPADACFSLLGFHSLSDYLTVGHRIGREAASPDEVTHSREQVWLWVVLRARLRL